MKGPAKQQFVWPREIILLIGIILLLPSRLLFSQQLMESEKQALKERAKSLFDQGVACYNQATHQDKLKALDCWNQSAALYHRIGRSDNEGLVLYNISIVYQDFKDQKNETLHLKKCLAAFSSNPYPEREVEAYRRVGEIHRQTSQSDSALFYLKQAGEKYHQLGNRKSEASTLDSIGRIYHAIGRLEIAVDYLNQACTLFIQTGDQLGLTASKLELQGVWLGIGNKLIREGKTEEGRAIIEKYLKASDEGFDDLAKILQSDENITTRENLFGKECSQQDLTRFTTAMQLKDPNLSALIAVRLLAKKAGSRQEEAMALCYTGDYYVEKSRPAEALAYYDSALTMQRHIEDVRGMRTTLTGIARTWHRCCHPMDLNKALRYYQSAAEASSRIVTRAGEDPDRVSMAEQDIKLYGEWVLACLALAKESGEQKAILSALAASEQGRTQAMLSLMQRTSSVIKAQTSLYQLGSSLVEDREPNTTILNYMLTADTLLVWIIPPRGGVELYRKGLASESLARLAQRESATIREGALAQNARQSLGELVAAMRFAMGVANTRTVKRIAGGINDRDVIPLEQADATSLAILAQGANSSESKDSEKAYLHNLSAILLPTEVRVALPASGEIIVIAHGALDLVPFAALPLGDSEVTLGQHYALRYAPSLQVLAEAGKRPGSDGRLARKSILQKAYVIGNPAMPQVLGSDGRKVQLTPLQGAQQEGQWLASYAGVPFHTGTAASETELKRQAGGASLLHFATHGYAYAAETRARDSFIALAPDHSNDGLLTVGEVLDQLPALSAELVVLSACQTGLGNIQESEGTIGLQRAFLAKGSRGVLVSLWNVSDPATLLLMKRFYQHLIDDTDNPSKSEALRRAQNDVRKTSGFEAPRYWAAFQLVGAN